MRSMSSLVVLLVSLLTAPWGASGEPPGQITTGAVIQFGADPQYVKAGYDGVQGLRYFATTGTNQLPVPALQQPVLVYPGSVLGAGPVVIPTQVGIHNVATGNKGVPYYGYLVPSTSAPLPPVQPPIPPSPPPPPQPPPPPLPPQPVSPPPFYNTVDLTYDSLSSSSSQNGISYNPPSYTTPVPLSAPQPMITSPPPMQATTYGPAKPIVLRPYLKTRNRGTYVLGPPHHHISISKAAGGHYHHLIPVMSKHIRPGPPAALLVKAKPHIYPPVYATHNPQPARPPSPTLYGPPVWKSQSSPANAINHPDITKAIFHSQPVDSYAAAAALSNTYTNAPYSQISASTPAAYNAGTGSVIPQQFYAVVPYSSLPMLRQRSDDDIDDDDDNKEGNNEEINYSNSIINQEEEEEEEKTEEEDEQSLLYNAYYHKPELDPYKEDMRTRNVLGPESLSGVPSSSWMPINAPEGAVPARAYEIPAPDLSRGGNGHRGADEEGSWPAEYPRNHRISGVPQHDHYFPRTDSGIRQRNVYKGNSEEVVSAVVLVKQK